MAKPKIHSTTQDFTEITDIVDDVVYFKGHTAASVIEVSSVNFYLLSAEEQNARIYGYMALLNSLSFALQILIVSRRVDLSNYIKVLDQRIASVQNPKIREHLTLYKEFILELVKGGQLLDKKNYIVIPFSSLELGPLQAGPSGKQADFRDRVKAAIATKRNNVVTQIERMGLMSRVLSTEELAKLFYEVLNGESINLSFTSGDIKNVIL